MALRPNEFAARDGDRIEFRSDPLRVRVELNNLSSGDGHDLRCTFEFSVRVGEHSADRQMFVELLMADRAAVLRDDVATHLRPTLENSAESAANQPVGTVLSESGRQSLLEALRRSADAAGFSSGLTILPPFQLELNSPSLHRQQRETAQRSRVEEQAAGRLDHLRHAADLLKQFDSIRLAAPSMSAGQVLERIAPDDRGALLNALLAGSAERETDQPLYAVAGSYLVKIPLGSDAIQPVAIELPSMLGPLRSVQSVMIDGDRQLLVGARGGVLLVNPHQPKQAIAYADPELNSSLGFNRAIYLPEANSIFATHGEAGLLQWDCGIPSVPKNRMSAAELAPSASGPVRNIAGLDKNAAVCSVGNCLTLLLGSERTTLACESAAPIINIVPGVDRIFAIHEDSAVTTLDLESRRIIRTDHHGGDLSAACGLPWLDGLRLLLACAAGSVDCIGPDDSLVTRFNSVYRGFRNITASTNWIAALSPDRQRLILWNTWDGRAPAHDLHLISLTRHRIADIAFA